MLIFFDYLKIKAAIKTWLLFTLVIVCGCSTKKTGGLARNMILMNTSKRIMH